MDEIRAYHERLASFETWSKNGDTAKKDVLALLADPDPEIRRAAVLSVAAMGDVDALPTLLKIAKEDKDPRVRAAVFDAVERLSKSGGAPKTPDTRTSGR
jgi:HEAT repeat protein